MGRPEEYRRYARECLEVASGLRVPRARAALHHVAQVWLRLAQDAEVRSSRLREDELSAGTIASGAAMRDGEKLRP
jgi:hypothetical protein